MPETRTPIQHLLIINLHRTQINRQIIRRYLYGSEHRQPTVDYMAWIGNNIDLEINPLDVIMREVDWKLEQHPGTRAICLVGGFQQEQMNALSNEVERQTGLPVYPVLVDKLLGA